MQYQWHLVYDWTGHLHAYDFSLDCSLIYLLLLTMATIEYPKRKRSHNVAFGPIDISPRRKSLKGQRKGLKSRRKVRSISKPSSHSGIIVRIIRGLKYSSLPKSILTTDQPSESKPQNHQQSAPIEFTSAAELLAPPQTSSCSFGPSILSNDPGPVPIIVPEPVTIFPISVPIVPGPVPNDSVGFYFHDRTIPMHLRHVTPITEDVVALSSCPLSPKEGSIQRPVEEATDVDDFQVVNDSSVDLLEQAQNVHDPPLQNDPLAVQIKDEKALEKKSFDNILQLEKLSENIFQLIIENANGVNKLKNFPLSPTMHVFYKTDLRRQIASTNEPEKLVKLCSDGFSWFCGMYYEEFFYFLRNESIKNTEESEKKLWAQLCSYIKDPDRIKSETDDEITLIVDSELQKQLAGNDNKEKFRYLCQGILGKNIEFFL